MNKKQLVETVEGYLEPILAELNYELVDVEYVKEGPDYYLRIYIDKEGGINIEDCRLTSRAIEEVLDEKDIIRDAYILEVSSPGLDRILKREREYEKYKGRMVDVKLYEAINKQKHLTAELVEKTADELILDDEGTRLAINLKNVAQVRLAIMF
ncbi:ribosome maturation factor RimP [Cellulosilyticum ruminicola]|uniref:ribosome maturation factor RimP n=1 Tax=Cellulosilyticum ruminicola TaxID=425254 RepID=UPI0006D0B897|nr:ribosome maturation factor RimP [Cellulosilyticum ruminicola]